MGGFLRGLLRADAQTGDAYGWLCNQAGHAALVGMPAVILLLAFGVGPVLAPIAVALVYGVLWEWLIQRGRDWRDSVIDTACVLAGASVLAGALGFGLVTAAAALAIWCALLAVGVWRRI